MLLHCEREEGPGSERFGLAASWLRAETFESLAELNEQCLELLAEQATVRTAQSNLMLRQIGEAWRTLDASARRRAAACPYLLVDAGFADPHRWRWAGGHHVGDREHTPFAPFFTVPRATGVARLVFTYAWYLARTQNAAARLVLAMPAHCTNLIGACTLRQIYELAERHPDWLKPRWPGRVKVWRELLLAAASGEGVALERARMHGLQLLAAESRAAAP
jgi:hypothetical protein